MEAYIYYAKGHDPYENLATEEFFTDYVTKHPEKAIGILYFWQNEDCVVFGRNQNVANECNLSYLQQWNVHPVRRKTGGGAVFHDVRNLNFSFIVSKHLYDRDTSMQMIVKALQKLGIAAQVNGRNDILLEGAKISGNAYASNDVMALHHGTLLLSVSLDKLEKLLTVDASKLRSKGIHSVRSRVQNLGELYPLLTVEDYEKAITEQFCNCYHIEQLESFPVSDVFTAGVLELKKQYASPDWIFGHDLAQLKSRTKRFSWGTCTVSYFGADAAHTYVDIYSDTLYVEAFEQVRQYVRTVPEIEKGILSTEPDTQQRKLMQMMTEDIRTLLVDKES